MLVYIKRRQGFELAMAEHTESYSLPIASATGETGTAVLAGYDNQDHTGDWLYIGGQVVLISQASPKDGKLSISTGDAAGFFDRQLIWPDAAPATYGEFIRQAIETEFINCPDEAYKVPYISVANTDATPMPAMELTDTKLYKLSDIMSQARKAGVIIEFAISSRTRASDTLSISISTAQGGSRSIVFSDGHSQLATETYSSDSVAKVTVLQEAEQEDKEAEPVYSSTDWYLSTAGEISPTPPAQRAAGRWEYTTAKADEEPETKAAEIFAANLASHKIEFYSDKRLGLLDTVLLRLNGAVFKTQIASVVISSGDDRYLYKCGELAVTLPEKVRGISSSRSGATVIYQGGGGGGGTSDYTALTNKPAINGIELTGNKTGEALGLDNEVYIGPELPTGLLPKLWVDTDETGGGSSGGLEMVKLWENASPGSAFAAQTVSVSYNGYDRIGVQYNRVYSESPANIGSTPSGNQVVYGTDDRTSGFIREATINESGIVFGNNVRVFSTKSPITVNDNMIPLEIYGIKLASNLFNCEDGVAVIESSGKTGMWF